MSSSCYNRNPGWGLGTGLASLVPCLGNTLVVVGVKKKIHSTGCLSFNQDVVTSVEMRGMKSLIKGKQIEMKMEETKQ